MVKVRKPDQGVVNEPHQDSHLTIQQFTINIGWLCSCRNNVVMLDFLAVASVLSFCLANKVAVTTLRCNIFQLKRHRNALVVGGSPRTPLWVLTDP